MSHHVCEKKVQLCNMLLLLVLIVNDDCTINLSGIEKQR